VTYSDGYGGGYTVPPWATGKAASAVTTVGRTGVGSAATGRAGAGSVASGNASSGQPGRG
jgi:hypothetical protein